MTETSFSFKLKSHPHLLLVDHLSGVAEGAKTLLHEQPVRWENADEQTLYTTLISIACWCHDFGKATVDFQKYIESISAGEKARKTELSQHQRLSALFAYWIAEKYLTTFRPKENFDTTFYPLLAYLWVKKHHGNLKNLFDRQSANDELEPMNESLIQKQIQRLIEPEFSVILKTVGKQCGLFLDKNDFESNYQRIAEDVFRIGRQFHRQLRREPASRLYFLFQYCYSLLLTADKYHAILGNLPEQGDASAISFQKLQQFRKEKFSNTDDETGQLRDQIYQECVETAANAPLKAPFFALNVPTGSGKTLAALGAALTLAERSAAETGNMPKIIYCLPFMSIIDQNHQVFAEVFDHPDADIMVKHHSLTEMTFKGHEYDADVAALLIEGWDARLVVTTFVQFFHTIIGNRNMMVRRLHQLSGSIIILDEIQTMPHRFWPALENIFERMADIFQCRFILMTATLPKLLPENNLVQLVPNKDRYFQLFNRYHVEIDLQPQTISELAVDIQQIVLQKHQSDILIIVNTTRVARELFQLISKDQKEHQLFHLSTRLTPHDRLVYINKIRDCSLPKIVVSTQLVEAGVDLDFDIVIRDFAPLDSLNQAAGRCNRNGKRKTGDVRFIILCNEKGHPYYRYIYGKDDLIKMFSTKQIVEHTNQISEQEFLHAIRTYYEAIREKQSTQLADDMIEAMDQLAFSSLGNYKLIDEDYPVASVFIPQNEDAIDIWQHYTRLLMLENSLERRKHFIEIKPTLMQFMVSIPANQLNDELEQHGGLYFLPVKILHKYYSSMLGYLNETPTSSADFIF